MCSYQLGSGEAQILSREAVNDGRWHKVTAVRYGATGAARGSRGNLKNSLSINVLMCAELAKTATSRLTEELLCTASRGAGASW